MFVVRKLPIRSVSQFVVNSLFIICKRKDVKVLSCLQAHRAAKTYVGTSRRTFLLPLKDGKFQVRYKSRIDVNDRNVNYKEFTKLLDQDNTVVIDVREEDEIRRTGSVPGSINIPLDDVTEALNYEPEDFKNKYDARKPDEDDTIIFMCRRGERSLDAVKLAVKEGYTNAKSFDGGFLRWLDHERQKTKY